MKIGCIIQARAGSTRLPNKVFMPFPIEGKCSDLEWVVKRVSKSKHLDQIIIATTLENLDDKIEQLTSRLGVVLFRGSTENVLSRYYLAAKENELDIIVRITGDCPCIDSEVIDQIIDEHLSLGNDFTSNTLIRSYPHGLDVEVFNFQTLQEAFENATEDMEKEHVTPYIYKTRGASYQISQVVLPEDYSHIRVTLDTYEDYLMIAAIYDMYPDGNFKLDDIIDLFKMKPWLAYINSGVEQKKQFSSVKEELVEIVQWAKKQDLHRAANYIEGELNELENDNIN